MNSEPSFLAPMITFTGKFAGEALHFMHIEHSCKLYHVLLQFLKVRWVLKKELSLELLAFSFERSPQKWMVSPYKETLAGLFLTTFIANYI